MTRTVWATGRGMVVIRGTAARLTAASGMFHLLYAPTHFEERSDVGFFFLIAGVDQVAAGVLLLFLPSLPLILAALLGNAAVVVMYATSRTTGLPIGPAPGEPEGVGVFDLLTTFMEVMAIPLLGCLAWVYRTGAPARPGRRAPASLDPVRATTRPDDRPAQPAGRTPDIPEHTVLVLDEQQGRAEIGFAPSESIAGSALVALAEGAARTLCERIADGTGAEPARVRTVQVTADLVQDTSSGRLVAHARVTERSGTRVVVETRLRDELGQELARVTSTHAVGADSGTPLAGGNGQRATDNGQLGEPG